MKVDKKTPDVKPLTKAAAFFDKTSFLKAYQNEITDRPPSAHLRTGQRTPKTSK